MIPILPIAVGALFLLLLGGKKKAPAAAPEAALPPPVVPSGAVATQPMPGTGPVTLPPGVLPPLASTGQPPEVIVQPPTLQIPPAVMPPAVNPTAPGSASAGIPVGDLTAQSDARMILATWGQADGKGIAAVADYGSYAEIAAIVWTDRDQRQAASFVTWYDPWDLKRRNAGLQPGMTGIPAPLALESGKGQWTPALYDALQAYARWKLTSLGVPAEVINSVPPPTVSTPAAVPPPVVPAALPPPAAPPPVVPAAATPVAAPPVVPAAMPTVVMPPIATVPVSVPLPTGQTVTVQIPAAIPQTIATQAEQHPQLDPNGTIVLAQNMINAEGASGWKTALSTAISDWQKIMKLTADGKFGPKSAVKMAEEVAVLPLVRYYASTGGSQSQQVAAYRTQLLALATQLEAHPDGVAHAKGLRSSAAYETGLGYAVSPKAVPVAMRQSQAAALAAQL